MTVQIPKSKIGPEFELEVAHFAQAMRDWRAHMGRVGDDERNGVTGINKHVPYPRPIAIQLVDEAVDEDGNPDYEIVDDTPSPDETLPERKQKLLNEVSIAEAVAIEAIAPRAKQRWQNLQEQEIRDRDVAVVRQVIEKEETGLLNAVKKAAGWKSPSNDIAKAVNDARSDEDQKILADAKAQRVKIADIQKIAAKAHAEIYDLTVDTIDKWTMPEFPA